MAKITVIQPGTVLRATTGLNVRNKANGADVLATLIAGALVTALASPANGWVQVSVTGRCPVASPVTLRYEDSEKSLVIAKVHKTKSLVDLVPAMGGWRFVRLTGFCSVRFTQIVQPNG